MPKTKETKLSPNDYRGTINQDDKGTYWLKGGITPVGRVFFPSVFQSKLTFDGNKKQQSGKQTDEKDREWSCILIFKKTDPKLKSMEKKIQELAQLGLGLKKGEKFGSPIKDGNDMYNKDPGKYGEYKNTRYINLKRPAHLDPPIVLDEDGETMMSASDFYAGCYATAQVAFKPYDTFGGGITCYWSGIKKVADGEKLGYNMEGAVKNEFDKQDSGVSVDKNGNVTY
jgi:hypothetical protein